MQAASGDGSRGSTSWSTSAMLVGVVMEGVKPVSLPPKWYTGAQVAELRGYGESKVRMLIIAGDLRSLKDGRSRRVLPEWVDEYVARRAAEAEQHWWSS